jgi:hypothetical protein
MMHSAVGTALGRVTTLVGEPQNLLFAQKVGWEFVEFFVNITFTRRIVTRGTGRQKPLLQSEAWPHEHQALYE